MNRLFRSILLVGIVLAFITSNYNYLQAEEKNTYDKLVLVDEKIENGNLVQIFLDENEKEVINSVELLPEVLEALVDSNDHLLMAKQFMLAHSMKFGLDNKKSELLLKSVHKSAMEVNSIEISSEYEKEFNSTQIPAIEYAEKELVKFEQLSFEDQEALRGYTEFYSDYGDFWNGENIEFLNRLNIDLKSEPDSLTIDWSVYNKDIPEGIAYMYVGVDSKVESCSLEDKDTPCLTELDEGRVVIEDLEPSTTYKLIFAVYDSSGNFKSSLERNVNTPSKSKEDNSFTKFKRLIVDPETIDNEFNIDAINHYLIEKGTLTYNLEQWKDKDNITAHFKHEMIEALGNIDGMIHIDRKDVELFIPTSILPSLTATDVMFNRVRGVEGAVGTVYDFTISQDSDPITQFDAPVRMVFLVDNDLVTDPNKLAVYYLNEKNNTWELVGGTYNDGEISVEVNHFSTYAVFEEYSSRENTEDVVANVEDKSDQENGIVVDNNNNVDDEPVGKPLPNTATSVHDLLMIGAIIILIGITLLFHQKRNIV
ncbi:hypothetical protein GMD78_06305 [Ornithinibacillus sp. L9]|uniref:Uncharacterized protein n=1 Tax=Ornithinibacillus caprae TaxID=2678566 RepID=A0A6N8FEN7_9BACI|nr:hypothetical protein [Ornithinibacillus caprae]MUK88010.1 hypothetical protein [Ornithinibacillus caprae]